MKGKKLLGIILLVLGTSLFIFDFIRMGSILLYILTFMAFISPILSGKKVASYTHDSTLAKKRGINASPASFIYLWLFFWLFFLLLYTIGGIIFSEAIKFFFSALSADYLGLLYTLILFFGSFYLFEGIYASNKNFLTIWGKSLEKSRMLSKNVVGRTKNKVRNFEKYL